MNRIVLAGSLMLAAMTTDAFAQRRCTVDDPSGTPLNVRAQPNGQILGALHNGVRVVISDISTDNRGRRWALITPMDEGRRGWVFRDYLACD
jgi:hypothetical protein